MNRAIRSMKRCTSQAVARRSTQGRLRVAQVRPWKSPTGLPLDVGRGAARFVRATAAARSRGAAPPAQLRASRAPCRGRSRRPGWRAAADRARAAACATQPRWRCRSWHGLLDRLQQFRRTARSGRTVPGTTASAPRRGRLTPSMCASAPASTRCARSPTMPAPSVRRPAAGRRLRAAFQRRWPSRPARRAPAGRWDGSAVLR